MYKELNDYEILYLVKENDEDNLIMLFKKYKPVMDEYIYKYLPYAKKIGLEYDDLYQCLCLTLIKTVKMFDENQGNLFYTYLKRSFNYCLMTELRNNNTQKNKVLNESISYDTNIPNGKESYIDYIYITNEIDSDYIKNIVNFKNILPFDSSCIFELIYNGYSKLEISKLLLIKIKDINIHLRLIKKSARSIQFTI